MFRLSIQLLDELINIQKDLIIIADKKREYLIERKIDELNQLVKKEEEIVTQFANKKREFENQLIQFNNNNDITLSEYIESIHDESVKKQLQTKQTALYEDSLSLQEKNNLNEHLLKDSLKFVNQMIGQLTKSKQQSFNYSSPLQKQQSSVNTKGFFDTKA